MPEADKQYYKENPKLLRDVSDGQWYSDAVACLVAAGVITGYEDGTFRGANEITRAEFVTIASRFEELDLSGDMPFSDVPAGHWAYDFVLSAYNYGWTSGYPDGTFGPNRNINRAEAVTFINNMMGWSGLTPPEGADVKFTDLTGDEWYYSQVVLSALGITP